MARNLESDLKMLSTVLALAQNRDIRRAAAIAEQALAEGFEHPLLLNVLAARLEEDGKYDDAVRLLERAVTLAPADVPARNALALCLQRLDRAEEALYHVEQLLKAHPELGFAHANKGNALIALGLLAPAQTSHQRALELDPNNVASMSSLAAIATHRGEHAEARQWAGRVLARVPGFPDAVLSIAAAELADGAIARAESLLREVIADPRAGPSDKARAYSLLGDVLDADGRYDEAFNAYSACNESLRQLHRRYAVGISMLEYTRTLTAALTAVMLRWPGSAAGIAEPSAADASVADASAAGPSSASASAAGDSAGGAAGHVLLIGFPRSGTTLLDALLDGHPQVVSLEEHELLTESVLTFIGEPLDFGPLARAGEPELRAFRSAYWDRVRRSGVDVAGKIFVDKYPLNTLKLPLIARLFPGAKILFARRDPRDVVFSCFRRRFRMNPAMYQMLTLNGAANFYDAVMDFAERARPLLSGLGWHEVRYERLMADFEGQMRAVCGFLGLEWSADMAEFATRARARERATPSTAQLARGLDTSGLGHWQHYRAQIEPIQPVLERWVTSLDRDG